MPGGSEIQDERLFCPAATIAVKSQPSAATLSVLPANQVPKLGWGGVEVIVGLLPK